MLRNLSKLSCLLDPSWLKVIYMKREVRFVQSEVMRYESYTDYFIRLRKFVLGTRGSRVFFMKCLLVYLNRNQVILEECGRT